MIFRSNRFLYLVVRFSKKLHRKWTAKNAIVISIVSFQMTSLKLSILILRFHFVLCFTSCFWTQACPEGIGTNGIHRSHARCHPYLIPQPVKVGHTTGVYVPYSFRTVVWVLLRPTRTDQ